jgi:hypothetical protein
MFETRLITTDLNSFDRPAYASHAALLSQALTLFNQARWNATVEKGKNLLLRRVSTLIDLESISANTIRASYYGGLKVVSINRICGTLGRTSDFDNGFNPLDDRIRDRWVSIAMARKQNISLGLVELIQVGDRYFVKDGHHRISVARTLGETAIDAEVVVWEVNGILPWEKQAVSGALVQSV